MSLAKAVRRCKQLYEIQISDRKASDFMKQTDIPIWNVIPQPLKKRQNIFVYENKSTTLFLAEENKNANWVDYVNGNRIRLNENNLVL